MTIKYIPTGTIFINEFNFSFGESRSSIRSKLPFEYSEDNHVFEFEHPEDVIHQRRDKYATEGFNNYFFLVYSKEDLLTEFEIHNCDNIEILSEAFGFKDDLDEVSQKLQKLAPLTKKKDGEYFFNDLRLVIINNEQMGGEGNTLGYFYCATDVSHLEE